MTPNNAICSVRERWRRLRPRGSDPSRELSLRLGDIHDYDTLSRYHYRPRPATFVRVLSLVDKSDDRTPVAALVVSMPTLNGSWRSDAFPALRELLARNDKRAAATWINQHLRTISRVVVDPRWRGLGLAKRLVQEYLRAPMTPYTEAIAIMGEFNPFLARAGMRPFPRALPAADARLLDALAHARITLDGLARRLNRSAILPSARDRFLRQELQRWARAARATGRHARWSPAALASLAEMNLGTRPLAYAHLHHPPRGRSR